jgi:phenylalanyl-tRNA synthetase beta chain
MKVSYNWLKKYLDFDLSVKELSEILTDTGLEVEGIKKMDEIPGGLEGLVIGEVTECIKHPDADRLHVAQVDVGSETLQIVCGAPNIKSGQHVVVALVGSTLYPTPEKPFKIKKAKIRGISSTGMICAEDEIGMGASHDGIMVLDNAKAGTLAATHFNLSSDHQLEISLTPNRCDAMGHIGVARDIKAFINYHRNKELELKLPKNSNAQSDGSRTLSIQIKEPELCHKYIGATIEGVTISDSPDWLQKALKSIDIEPINNVVDITNYVMFEYGTPLHAFDLNQINEKVVVKKGKKNDLFKTLDGVERKLNGEELMITNGDSNLCIAGVYGGLTSGVSQETTALFIESALFDSTSVRKTSKAHGLQTDASFRYERGVDPTFTESAMERTLSLIIECAGGKITMAPKCVKSQEIPRTSIEVNTQRLIERLGVNIQTQDIINILDQLDFVCTKNIDPILEVIAPAYRRDVYREEDVMEEVLRIYGFNKVPIPKKWNISFQNKEYENSESIQRTLSELFVSNGFNEVINNSLSKELFEEESKSQNTSLSKVSILNPLSSELEVMRRSLLVGLCENVKYNQNRQKQNIKLFEFGKTYDRTEKGFIETRQMAFVISGNQNPESWRHPNKKADFFEAKELCKLLCDKLGLNLKESESEENFYFKMAQQLRLKKNKLIEYGEIADAVKKTIGFKGTIFAGIVDIDFALSSSVKKVIQYKELPKTFFVKRDFSLILDENVTYSSIQKIARDSEKRLLKSVNLFDVYEGNKLPKGKKSYAVSFLFQDQNDTLKDEQIDSIMETIRVRLQKDLGAELRA